MNPKKTWLAIFASLLITLGACGGDSNNPNPPGDLNDDNNPGRSPTNESFSLVGDWIDECEEEGLNANITGTHTYRADFTWSVTNIYHAGSQVCEGEPWLTVQQEGTYEITGSQITSEDGKVFYEVLGQTTNSVTNGENDNIVPTSQVTAWMRIEGNTLYMHSFQPVAGNEEPIQVLVKK